MQLNSIKNETGQGRYLRLGQSGDKKKTLSRELAVQMFTNPGTQLNLLLESCHRVNDLNATTPVSEFVPTAGP